VGKKVILVLLTVLSWSYTTVWETNEDPRKEQELRRENDKVNRNRIRHESEMPQARTFADGLEFLECNKNTDNWFLQIETFDPHEPFFTQPEWQNLYPEIAKYQGKIGDWPNCCPVMPSETKEDIEHVRRCYAALVSMCDYYLGTILDFMDEHDMWKDTMLIVNTDHGFLLGEHDWWTKVIMPPYEEISHTPLFIYDPISRHQGERRTALTSAIDLPVTILDFFGITVPEDMQGLSLMPIIRENATGHNGVLFGIHACQVAVTDGRYTYFRAPRLEQEKKCYDYTLMPTRMKERFSVEDVQKAVLVHPKAGTKECPVLKIPGQLGYYSSVNYGTKLYDLLNDPEQLHPIDNPMEESRMANLMVLLMELADSPDEQYERLGLPKKLEITPQWILESRIEEKRVQTPDFLNRLNWEQNAINAWRGMKAILPKQDIDGIAVALKNLTQNRKDGEHLVLSDISTAFKTVMPSEQGIKLSYVINLSA
jgi:hypothetical protein